MISTTVKPVFALICVLISHYAVKGSNNLIWKTYYNATVPKGCISIPGQTKLYIGLADFAIPGIDDLSGLIPTTVYDGSLYVNVTLDSKSYYVQSYDVDLKILCGIENSEGTLDFVSTSADTFSSLFDTNTKPIPLGSEFNHKSSTEENWYNATLYAGIVDFYSSEGRHRVVVGKVYENATEELNYNAFYGDLRSELSSSTYDVLVLRT
jgi:hypothetical protein